MTVFRTEGATGTRRGKRRDAERGLLLEDRALEASELEARLEPELLHERATRVAIRGERLRLPPRAVQREHQLGAQALPKRVLGD